jgi:hypothetical protein
MHVSKVWKYDSKTIYKLQGIHGLQKYKFRFVEQKILNKQYRIRV